VTAWPIAERRGAFLAAALLIGVAGAWVLYTYPPVTSGFYPQCAFRSMTGFDCPGCGTTRALHALLHGHIGEALRLNPFLFAVMALIGFSLPGWLRGEPPRFLYTRWFGWGSFAVVMAWWIGRNLYR
jgi:Protein of unknown function (DUF2752)